VEDFDLIVIGGGPGGLATSRFVRRLKPEWKILVIRSQEKSIIPCAMPYAIDGTIKTGDYIKDDERLLKKMNIGLLIDEVISIDSSKDRLSTAKGAAFSYRFLVLALGSYPAIPDIKGKGLKNVFAVKDHPDIINILSCLDNAKSATVIGAGFIGLEMVNVFHNQGIKVNLVEKETCCLPNNISRDFSAIVMEDLKKRGINLFIGRRAKELVGKDSIRAVILENDERVDSDIVIFSIGVRPNISLVADSRIETSFSGIKVNEFMQTNIPNVYAIGDCMENHSFITGKIAYGYLATNAVIEGKYAAMNLTGHKKVFPGIVNPAITRVFDISYGVVGLTKDEAERGGIDFVYGDTDVYTRERSFPGAGFLKMRLVFKKPGLIVIGAEVAASENVAWLINMLSLAVMNRNTAMDLASLQYCGHPPQVDVPAKMPLVIISENALKKESRM